VAAVAVHVIDDDVVTTSHCHAVVLVDDDAVANFSVTGSSEVKACKP
jgi:L-asparaginase II